MKLKFYHTSGTRFNVGDIIGGPGKNVFLHTNPVPHGTIQEIVECGYTSWEEYSIAKDAVIRPWSEALKLWYENPIGDRPECPRNPINPKPVNMYVYEMRPYNKPVFGNCNDEYIAINDFVEVVSIVGNAKGILDNFKRKFGDGAKAYHFGGKSRKPKRK